MLRIGDWRIDPVAGEISRDGEIVRLDGRTMKLLLCLAERAGEVISIDELLDQVWSGVVVTPDSVYQAVASLRRLLKDDSKRPTYIATVPRLGYRMVATVAPWADAMPLATAPPARRYGRVIVPLVAAAAVGLLLVLSANPAPSVRSVAVLPFLDLTNQEMTHEYFADGMTEELIHELSKVPSLSVTSSRNGATYVLDGSVRKSGNRMRIAARLVQASDSVVVWSETYDRSSEDLLRVQEDIAAEVTKALSASIQN
jgi:TolB-like protein/DNA-binding winged helix-turn-helix (wHTH) protein